MLRLIKVAFKHKKSLVKKMVLSLFLFKYLLKCRISNHCFFTNMTFNINGNLVFTLQISNNIYSGNSLYHIYVKIN